jgi:hypothetical protein
VPALTTSSQEPGQALSGSSILLQRCQQGLAAVLEQRRADCCDVLHPGIVMQLQLLLLLVLLAISHVMLAAAAFNRDAAPPSDSCCC